MTPVMANRVVRPLLLLLFLAGLAQVARGLAVPLKAAVAQALLERAFERGLAAHRPEKPWGWADMAPAARLRVPRLGVERIVLGSGSGQAMAFGPALLPGAAGLDEPGAVVIAAHRDTHFRFLQDLRAGDLIELRTIGGALRRYRVAGAEVVRWDRFVLPVPTSDRSLVLVTCFPFDALGHGPLRYVVHAVARPG